VRVEEASPEGFAEDYYAQLQEVFAKQGLSPTYDLARVSALIDHLHPTGRLLLLRAVEPGGSSIATGISLGMNGRAILWGTASWRKHQDLRGNEAIVWHAIRHWKKLGFGVLDLGGGGNYKLEYSPRQVDVPRFRMSRWRVIGYLRDLAYRAKMGNAFPVRLSRVFRP
jgi:CelD/BcsL family acetyltransferase involved in cellulose biosynthesis